MSWCKKTVPQTVFFMDKEFISKQLSKAAKSCEKKDAQQKNKPFYGMRTKKQVIEEYYLSSASMKELAEIHGILGSNTVSDWLKKYGNLSPKNLPKSPIMNKAHASEQDKKSRLRKYKTNEQLYLGQLEGDLELVKKRLRFYVLAMDTINDLALELTGIDLLKKTGHELSKRSRKQKL